MLNIFFLKYIYIHIYILKIKVLIHPVIIKKNKYLFKK